MKKQGVATAGRLRRKLLGASALMVLLAACGDHPPKDDGDDDEEPPVRTANISIVAGHATESGSRDANGASARFDAPSGITIDTNGNLYVVDRNNNTIRRITPAGAVTTIAGDVNASEYLDGVGRSARFWDPYAVTIDANGTLYITDYLRIRSMATTGLVTTLTTIPVGTNVAESGLGQFVAGGIAADSRGNLIVTNGIGTRRIATGTGATAIIEGVGVVNNVFGTRAFIPRGVAVDSDYVYLADREGTISRTTGSASLTRLAGTPNVTGSADGSGSAASFGQVVALTVDEQGNLYAADNSNNLVRKITPDGVVTTVAGTRGSSTLRTGDLPGSLSGIRGITTDGEGTLYATSGNAVIKIVLP